MAKKKKEPECPKCMPSWLAAFGDLMSLLLCFFVLLLSMSTFDAKKVSEAVASLTGTLAVLEGGIRTTVSRNNIQQTTPVEETDETAEAINMVKRAVNETNEMIIQGASQAITIEDSEDGFVVKLPASTLFKPGRAKIDNQDAILFLRRIALIIDSMPNDVEVAVRGHTDNTSLGSSSPFKDNWALSSARAISAAKVLIQGGVRTNRIHSEGYSSFKPIASNATIEGREKNRRVEIYFSSQHTNVSAIQKSILDK